MIGLVEIGTPGQPLAMQFDTRYFMVVVQSINETAEAAGALRYNMYHSSTVTSRADFDTNLYPQRLAGGDKITYTAWSESFDIGGVLFSNVPFGQLHDYYPASSDGHLVFNGASGYFGLQRLGLGIGFMSSIRGQLPCKAPSCLCDFRSLTKEDWVCTIDGYRLSQNGTLRLGSIDSAEYSGDIGWTEQNSLQWTVNLTMISAGDKTNPPDPQWSAAVATEDLSLSWPQHLLDWYFQDIDATWSALDKTYRYPCNITLPDFVFAVGNATFRVPGSYLPYQRDLSGNCISIITGDNSTAADYTFGLWWIQLGFLILDFDNWRVGFANKSTPLPSFGVSSLEVVSFA
jgi:hypothetical protein